MEVMVQGTESGMKKTFVLGKSFVTGSQASNITIAKSLLDLRKIDIVLWNNPLAFEKWNV